ncbi:MAG: hypothetical protein N2109_10735 [Fimbriimonadales bacterium]|nr:hypothetical protein [Fimbriimonadales bacterium]
MRIVLSAGEASGDAYGAALVRHARPLLPDAQWAALGGRRLLAAGVSLWEDTSSWGAMGVVQSLRVAPRAAIGFYRTLRRLRSEQPGWLVPIDFGFFNTRLARRAKGLGWKVLYFIPPGCWRRDRGGQGLRELVDAVSTPFPWSAENLRRDGIQAHWFGHPLRQLVQEAGGDAPERREALAVLPGSRLHELEANLPALAEALRDWPTPIVFPVAPTLAAETLRERWLRLTGRAGDEFRTDGAARALLGCRAAVVCSGTATLEAALCGCPMVVVYRLSRAMRVEVRLLRIRVRHISLPNILLQRSAVPELVDDAATPQAIRGQAEAVWHGPAREDQLLAFRELEGLLGPADGIARTAQLLASLARGA